MDIIATGAGNKQNALPSAQSTVVLSVVPQKRYNGCSRGQLKGRRVPWEYKLMRTYLGTEKETKIQIPEHHD